MGHRSPARLLFLFAPEEMSSGRGGTTFQDRLPRAFVSLPESVVGVSGLDSQVLLGHAKASQGREEHSHGSCGYVVLALAGPGETIC